MVILGLDYAGAEAGLRLAGIDADPELWGQLRVVEQAVKTAMNERQK